MKKIAIEKQQYFIRRQILCRKKQIRRAKQSKNSKVTFSCIDAYAKIIKRYSKERYNFKKNFYSEYTYTGKPTEVVIDREFGLERGDLKDYFFEKSSEFIDFNSRELVINLTNCQRIWPSGITLLCSLGKWVELATWKKANRPKIHIEISNNPKVDSYLYHSGFYKFFNVERVLEGSEYEETEVLKIKRENDLANIEKREIEIKKLLIENCDYSDVELEWFDSAILTEIFNNVTEHGVSHIDHGWWLLAQKHKTHKFISLCIADNGIGIRHSLMTGPQRRDIKKRYKNRPENDGDLIRLAIEENVSGAIKASVKEGFIFKKHKLGSRRGHGLQWIRDTCKELSIELTIISHHGYINFDKNGDEVACHSYGSRIFSGTFYHLLIPTER